MNKKTELKIFGLRFTAKVLSFQLTTLYQIRTRFEHGFSPSTQKKYLFLKQKSIERKG